jgi:hypothetical protein
VSYVHCMLLIRKYKTYALTVFVCIISINLLYCVAKQLALISRLLIQAAAPQSKFIFKIYACKS